MQTQHDGTDSMKCEKHQFVETDCRTTRANPTLNKYTF